MSAILYFRFIYMCSSLFAEVIYDQILFMFIIVCIFNINFFVLVRGTKSYFKGCLHFQSACPVHSGEGLMRYL